MKNKYLIRLAVLTVIALFLATFLLPVYAGVGTQSTSCTNSVLNNATITTSLGNAVKVDSSDSVSVVVKMQGDRAGTGNVVVKLFRSIDGLTYETTPGLLFTNALNGNTAVVGVTPIAPDSIRGVQWLKIGSLQNYDASATATNFSVTIATKAIKPER